MNQNENYPQKIFHKKLQSTFEKMARKTDTTLRLFLTDPLNPSLRNHALKGKLKGLRAISVTSDLRIIFEEKTDTLSLFWFALEHITKCISRSISPEKVQLSRVEPRHFQVHKGQKPCHRFF